MIDLTATCLVLFGLTGIGLDRIYIPNRFLEYVLPPIDPEGAEMIGDVNFILIAFPGLYAR